MQKRALVTVAAIMAVHGALMAQQRTDARHYIAAIEQDKFHGWPANNGAWQWGDEILVGFTQGEFDNRDGHNIKGRQNSMFARSLDGGETWSTFDPQNFLDDENIQWLPKGKTMLEKPMEFANSGFAMRVFATGYHGNDDPDGGFYYSYDRGATWIGPHFLGNLNSHPELKGKTLTPRTDYIVTGPRSCFVFITANFANASRIACIKTGDGGLTFEFVAWVTPETSEYRAIMPQTIRLANGEYLMAFRKIYADKSTLESAIDTCASQDECRTWKPRGRVKEIKENSNPPSVCQLDDGRLCCVYGDRDAQVMAGKYSDDNGRTWGEEFIIRDGYKSVDDWADMGYPRLVKRRDGKLAAMYYWACEEHPQQYIACSIWSPDKQALEGFLTKTHTLPEARQMRSHIRPGDGPALVLIPGTWGAFDTFSPLIKRLPQNTPIVVLELCWQAGLVPPTLDLSIEQCADDVLRVVADLKLDRFYVGGHSIGGMIAIEIAGREVPGLLGAIPMEGWAHHTVAATAFGGVIRGELTEEEMAASEAARSAGQAHLTQEQRDSIAQIWKRWNGAACLLRSKVPQCHLWGDRGMNPQPGRAALQIPDRPSIEVAWIAQASHPLLIEAPDAVAKVVRRFIESEPQRGSE